MTSRTDSENLTLVFLPSRSPELNPVENNWQFLRANKLSDLVFESYDAIIDAACEAWNRLIKQPDTIASIGLRHCPCRSGVRADGVTGDFRFGAANIIE